MNAACGLRVGIWPGPPGPVSSTLDRPREEPPWLQAALVPLVMGVGLSCWVFWWAFFFLLSWTIGQSWSSGRDDRVTGAAYVREEGPANWHPKPQLLYDAWAAQEEVGSCPSPAQWPLQGISADPSPGRGGGGQAKLMLAILETGLLMLGILHNFIDLFSNSLFLNERRVSHIVTVECQAKGYQKAVGSNTFTTRDLLAVSVCVSVCVRARVSHSPLCESSWRPHPQTPSSLPSPLVSGAA